MRTVSITALQPNELPLLKAALEEAGLPIADIADDPSGFFSFHDDDGLVGFGGLEGVGEDRLLRSVVIVQRRRGQGLGRHVLSALEAHA
ncbi:MAG: GNAT family N-acetyltransferase, partial [Pseudomonadota bacterium]